MTILPTQVTTGEHIMPLSGKQAPGFGQLVQRIVQSNSGRHRALVPPVPRLERADAWAEYRTMAERSQASGNFAHAEGMWLKAIAESNQFKSNDWRRGFSFDSLAGLCYAQGRYDEAEVFAVRALEATRTAYGDEHLKTAECEMFVGSICFSVLKIDEATAHVKCALFIYEALLEPVHAKIATACFNMALIYHMRGAFSEAEIYYQRAFKIRAHVFGWEHEKTTRVSKLYSEMTVDRQYHKEAKEILDRLIGPTAEAA
jgi:tetratricopeptide (TPR) repeat protein